MTSVPGHSDPLPALDGLVACPGCDLLHHRRSLKIGELARCDRCGDILQTNKIQSIDRTLAAVSASIILLLVSLCLPFLSLSRAGVNSTMSVLDAVASLWLNNMLWLGLLTLALIVLLPLTRLVLLAWVLARIRFHRKIRRGMRMAFRWSIRMEPWAMADIFMVGVVVSLVKVSTLANLHTGLAFWSLLLLVGLSIFINLTLCKDTIWSVLTHKGLSAREAGLKACTSCAALQTIADESLCSRCGAAVLSRRSKSLQRVWAFLIVGVMAYIPANIYPIMLTRSFTGNTSDTILSGIFVLMHGGSYVVALIIFVASICIPVIKFIIIGGLALNLHFHWDLSRHTQHRLHVLTEFIGRWSMIDVFVVAVLAALIQLGALISIVPGVGINAFALSVVFTMLAASSLDPRLLWDQSKK